MRSFSRLGEEQEIEGIVYNDGRSTYQEGIRTRKWLKVKVRRYGGGDHRGMVWSWAEIGPAIRRYCWV